MFFHQKKWQLTETSVDSAGKHSSIAKIFVRKDFSSLGCDL